jgi:hypothetical protein
MCIGGGCNWHPALLDQTTKPSSLTTAAEVARIGHLSQNSPFHVTNVHPAHRLQDLVAHHHGALEGRGSMTVTADLLLPAV